ncbi:hypothetical protein [Streptomyces sp. NPDC055992]|uniref:hypothetical protein n=1 Tax=Streptomyces sp. NPDC055992 TaxID=3345673 RepID=UPI0035E18F7C
MNEHLYLRYACARIVDRGAATATVAATLAEAAGGWPALLQGPHPAAAVWAFLRRNTDETVRRATCRDPLLDRLYAVLSSRVADAVVLDRKLQLTVKSAAGLMGADRAAVAGALLTAKRSLPAVFDSLGEE